MHLTEKRRDSNIKKNVLKITLELSECSPKFTLVLKEILEYWKRISFWNALKCITKVDLKHFLIRFFFDYFSSAFAFSKIFSVVKVFASLQKLTKLRAKDDWGTSSGTIFSNILKTFYILWLYQQSIKYFAKYEVLGNCVFVRDRNIFWNSGCLWLVSCHVLSLICLLTETMQPKQEQMCIHVWCS